MSLRQNDMKPDDTADPDLHAAAVVEANELNYPVWQRTAQLTIVIVNDKSRVVLQLSARPSNSWCTNAMRTVGLGLYFVDDAVRLGGE